MKLQSGEILEPFNLEFIGYYKSCLLGKMKNSPFTGNYERGAGLLDIIHSYVCGPFRHITRHSEIYFVTFINEFSRYRYVYLIKHKSDTFEEFKKFQREVENQLGKKIKIP